MSRHSKRMAVRQGELSKRKKRPAHRPQQGDAEGVTTPSAGVAQTDAATSAGGVAPGVDASMTTAGAPVGSRPAQAATFKAPRRAAVAGARSPALGGRTAAAGNVYLASDLRGVAAVSALMLVVLIVLAIFLS